MGAKEVILFGSSPCSDWSFLAPLKARQPDVICADGGVNLARQAGLTITGYVGDGDSGGEAPAGVPKVLLPRVKDVTDLEQALLWALEQGYRTITMTGCTGGRQDHHLINMTLLETAARRGAEARIVDERNEIRCLIGPVSVQVDATGWQYFGLVPLDSEIRGVSIHHARYVLENAVLHRGSTLSVSNEPAAGMLEIKVDSGTLLLVLTKE
jgi:thiamine pyrophosphokinase